MQKEVWRERCFVQIFMNERSVTEKLTHIYVDRNSPIPWSGYLLIYHRIILLGLSVAQLQWLSIMGQCFNLIFCGLRHGMRKHNIHVSKMVQTMTTKTIPKSSLYCTENKILPILDVKRPGSRDNRYDFITWKNTVVISHQLYDVS